MLHLDIRYLATPPASYVHDRVVLLGDAAHAMPPNLGQGGGMAVEDATVLADSLAQTSDVPAALARYDEQRRPRTTAIARDAARLARTMTVRSPAATALRNGATRLLPASFAVRAMARWARWSPPARSPSGGFESHRDPAS